MPGVVNAVQRSIGGISKKTPIRPPVTGNLKADTHDSFATISPASHDVVFSLAI